jgi:hypothetical protein
VPEPVLFPRDWAIPLAWRSATSVIISAARGDHELADMPLDGGAPRTISRIPEGLLGLDEVHGVQLAAGLLPGAEVRDAGFAHRGPWPWWLRLLLAAGVLAAAVAARTVYRRRSGQAYTSNS